MQEKQDNERGCLTVLRMYGQRRGGEYFNRSFVINRGPTYGKKQHHVLDEELCNALFKL